MAARVIPLRINPGMVGDPAKGAPFRTDWAATFANHGVRFEVDVARAMSYPGGSYLTRVPPTDPVNNQPITNLAESYPGVSLGDGRILAPGAEIDFQNGGLDFSDTTTSSQGIEIPASVNADINTPYGGAVVTASIAGTTMTVTAVASGSVKAGQEPSGSGVTALTQVRAQLTSTETGGALGGRGTYSVSISQTVASTTINLAGARQRLGAAMLIRLPSAAHWAATGTTFTFFGDGQDNGAAPCFGNINFFGHPSIPNAINVRRQLAASTAATQPVIFLPEVDCWAMLGYAYRPDGTTRLQVITPNYTTTGDLAAGAANTQLNTQDWSATKFLLGRPSIFTSSGIQNPMIDFRAGWLSIVNLARDPSVDFFAALAAEYTRRIATGAYT